MKFPNPIAAVCLGLAMLTVVAGCANSSPQARIKKNQAAFDAYPTGVQAAIQRGEVTAGFTPEQVRLAQGEPDRVLKRTTAEGESETWIYRDKSSRIGIGLGLGFGGGSVGTGVGVSTGGRQFPDERLRVVFTAGRVTAVEQVSR